MTPRERIEALKKELTCSCEGKHGRCNENAPIESWNAAIDACLSQLGERGEGELFAWAREWGGDDSDLGNFIIEQDDGTGKPPDESGRWFPLYEGRYAARKETL